MPLSPPEWLTSHARHITSVFVSLARGPLVTTFLERAGRANTFQGINGELSPGQSERLMLVLYWVDEYRAKRVSPTGLYEVLDHLLNSTYKEV